MAKKQFIFEKNQNKYTKLLKINRMTRNRLDRVYLMPLALLGNEKFFVTL